MKFWFIMFWIQTGITIFSLYGWLQSRKSIDILKDILEDTLNEKYEIKTNRY